MTTRGAQRAVGLRTAEDGGKGRPGGLVAILRAILWLAGSLVGRARGPRRRRHGGRAKRSRRAFGYDRSVVSQRGIADVAVQWLTPP